MRAIAYPLLIASVAFLGACATQDTPKPGATPGSATAAKPGATSAPAPAPAPTPGTSIGTGKSAASSPFAALKDPNNILSRRSVYFDYDKFDVKDEFRRLVEAHAGFLKNNPSAKMLIQGNADERGSREYNVGLGQRRSDSVKKLLTLLGAREDQIESVSLGEEKPVCTEAAEGCWSKNRRGDMLYSGEY